MAFEFLSIPFMFSGKEMREVSGSGKMSGKKKTSSYRSSTSRVPLHQIQIELQEVQKVVSMRA